MWMAPVTGILSRGKGERQCGCTGEALVSTSVRARLLLRGAESIPN